MIKRQILIILTAAVVAFGLVAVMSVSAMADKKSDKAEVETVNPTSCSDISTNIIKCKEDKGKTDIEGTALWGVVKLVLNILTAGVGLVAVGGIIYGSILYTTAGGSQDRVKKAYGVFLNVGIGILLYAAMYGLMNWLVPGGVF